MTDGGRRRNRSLGFLCQCICICTPLYWYFSVFEVLHLYGDPRYCVVSGHNGRFGAGLSHRYRSDKWMRESCYPLCGWLSSLWFYPSDKTIQYISTENFLLFTLLHFALQLFFQQVARRNFSSDRKSLPILKDYGSDFLFLRVSIRRSGLSGSPPIE